MCEMVDDEKVDIASTVIDEDAPLEDDVIRSLRTSPIHSENKDRTSIDDFEIIKPISHGAFGRVLKKADMIWKNAVESILAERDILISVLNPFVAAWMKMLLVYTLQKWFLLWSIYILCVWFTVRQPDPSTPNLKIDLLAEIGRSPCILSEVDASLKTKRMKKDVDEKGHKGLLLSELKQKLLISPIPVIVASTAPFDKQPEVDVSDEEFLQFDTVAIPVKVTLNKVSPNRNGAANIKVAGTDMNNKSSRSHSVFTCWFSKRSSIAINQLKFRSPMA
uniref:CCR4-Not complex component Not1 C-terminal domain-containing protein n=1 Tax=Lactuca sativa TaxID=4236 RepID=A0A9R1XH35_LACSA|nr:hypothetical protein LSAT_V11C400204500 [Lactuca sativa]